MKAGRKRIGPDGPPCPQCGAGTRPRGTGFRWCPSCGKRIRIPVEVDQRRKQG